MTYADDWKAISSRIRGLMHAGELHARFLAISLNDSYGRRRRLRDQCERILSSLQTYRGTHEASLPPTVLAAIRHFVDAHGGLIRDTTDTPDLVHAVLVLLGAFETEISFLLSDRQEVVRARSERAFAHLQRSIVADAAFREKWAKALKEGGEVACEKLGGAHLLLHGIYAFKVNAEGERTDLVFQDLAGELGDEQRYADGLVLTEWKVVNRDATDQQATADRQFEAARKQARLYAQGALGGIELAGYRYLVVVSEKSIQTSPCITEGAVAYRHINIAVDPASPSRRKP